MLRSANMCTDTHISYSNRFFHGVGFYVMQKRDSKMTYRVSYRIFR